MAIAETAKMAVELSLDSSKFTRSVAKVQRGLGSLATGAKKAASNFAKIGAVAAGALAGLGVIAIKQGLQSLTELENATTSVTGAIKTMGKTGQVSADQIAGWANEIEAATEAAFDDKEITAATATLIRFGKISVKNIKPAMQVMTDLAARTGSVESASKLLAKALADPAKAAGALRKAGVILTKGQIDLIEKLVKTGKTAEAQKVLLDALSKTTKNAAKDAFGPMADAQHQLADAQEEVTKALAVGFLPVIQRVSKWLTEKLADPKVIASIKKIGDNLAAMADKALDFIEKVPWDKVGDGLKVAADFAGKLIGVFTSLPPQVQGTIIALAGLNKLSGGAVSGLVSELGKGLIKGVLGITAAVVNINAGAVKGPGGVPVGTPGGIPGGGGTGLNPGGPGTKLGGTAGIFVADMHEHNQQIADAFEKSGTTFGRDAAAAFREQANKDTIWDQLLDKLGLVENKYAKPAADPKGGMWSNLGDILNKGNLGQMPKVLAQQEQQTRSSIATLKERLATTIKAEAAAERAGRSAQANRLNAKTDAIRGKLEAANAKLAQIRAKKTQFTVKNNIVVSTSVAVSEVKRQARYSSRVARTTSLAAS